MQYRCYYQRGEAGPIGLGSKAMVHLHGAGSLDLDPPPQLFTVERLAETHVMVRELEADDLEQVFHEMQVESMNRRGFESFTQHIVDLGLTHTSMSVGDVIEDVAAEVFWECDMLGWRQLEKA